MIVKRLSCALPALVLLAGCGGEAPADDGRAASGDVLEGTISDDMLPVDRARSEPPLEDPEAFAKARTEAGAAGLPEGGREAEGPESAAAASASPAPEVTPLPLED